MGDRPSAEDRAMLYRVRDSLGIGSNDAIWTLLFAFQHYHSLYARFPKMIRAAAVSLAVVLVAALAGAVALGFGRQQGYHLGFIEGQRAAVAAAPDRPPSPAGRGR